MEEDKFSMDSENKKFSISEYKREVVKDDIIKMKKMMVIKPWEYIPVIGVIIYIIRFQYAVQGIDRGLLRKKIWKWHVIVTLVGLLYISAALMLLTPYLTYFIIKKSITETEQEMERD